MRSSFVTRLYFIFFAASGLLSCAERSEDKSLHVDEYTRLGIPEVNKNWSQEDYTQAYNVLAKLKWEKPYELPLKESQKSGRLFERMMSLDYLSFLQDTTVSLNEKAQRISEFTRVYNHWMDVYTVPIIKENYYHREIIAIQIFNLELMEAMVDLAHQINDSDDPVNAGLKSGYGAIKENYLSCLLTNLKTQSHASLFLQEDLDHLADVIYASVIANKQWMNRGDVDSILQSLHLVLDSASSDHLRSKYTSLEKSLKGS